MLVLTREQMGHARVETTKTLAKIYDTETNAEDVKKIKNRRIKRSGK